MKIMIVDDNKGMREVIKNTLGPLKAQIFECHDGSDAIRLYGEISPDFVLMDLAMKNIDGISAIDEIHKSHPDARIIMLTDYGDRFFRTTAKESGAYAYVLKENLHELPVIINSTLQ